MTPDTPADPRRAAALAVVLTLAAACWLAAVHTRTATAAGFGAEWLSIALLALAPALVLGRAAARAATRRRAADGALLGLAAAGATLIGAVAALLLEGSALVVLDVLRDGSLALFATVPAATAAVGLLWVAPAPARVQRPAAVAPPPAPARTQTTRRGFLQLGAGSVTTVAVGTMAARGVLPDTAQANTLTFAFTITDGWRDLVDRTQGFFRGFKLTGTSGGPAYPGPPIGNPGPGSSAQEVFEGDSVRLVITNETQRDHVFLIEQSPSEQPSNPIVGPIRIPAGSVTEIPEFVAPQAGTYVYRDADVRNRMLGMHGVMVVQANDRRNVPYSAAPGRLELPVQVEKTYTWVLQDYDQMLGEVAAANPTVGVLNFPLEQIVPRFFFINGENGDLASHNEEHTVPVVPAQVEGSDLVGVLLRVVNTGVASHSPHWHGNHVFIVQRNARPQQAGLVEERDVVRMEPLACIDVILPAHTGYDAFPPTTADPDHPALHDPKHPGIEIFPMHCHAEMSQSAAGGMYPLGMLTDWHLGAEGEAVQQQIAKMTEQRAEARRAVGGGAGAGPPAAGWSIQPQGARRPRRYVNKPARRRPARRRAAARKTVARRRRRTTRKKG